MPNIRIDTAVREEISRVDSIMAQLTNSPAWLYNFGQDKSKSETENGLVRLSESLRHAHLAANEAYNPLYHNITKFFHRCDTSESRANNIAEIEKILEKRKIERIDADEGIFFEPQLTDFDPTRYRILKKVLGKWKTLIPVRAIPIGAAETKYTMWEHTGEAEDAGPGSMTGVPYVGVKNERFTNPIVTAEVGYQMTTDDQRKAAFSGEPLLDELLGAAQDVLAKRLDRIVWNGKANIAIEGVINHSGVPDIQAAAPAVGTDKSWSGVDKTNDEVFADMNNSISQVAINSRENWTPENTVFNMIIDRATKQSLNRRMASGTDTTLIQFVRNNVDVGIGRIEVIPDIAGSGPSSSNQALFYPMDEKVLRFRVNEEILWAPMQWEDLNMKFPGEIIHGGVEIIYPVAMIQMFDI